MIKVKACGSLFTVLYVGLMRRLPPFPFIIRQYEMAEDWACCNRLIDIGAEFFVNMDCVAGHIDSRYDDIHFSTGRG